MSAERRLFARAETISRNTYGCTRSKKRVYIENPAWGQYGERIEPYWSEADTIEDWWTIWGKRFAEVNDGKMG